MAEPPCKKVNDAGWSKFQERLDNVFYRQTVTAYTWTSLLPWFTEPQIKDTLMRQVDVYRGMEKAVGALIYLEKLHELSEDSQTTLLSGNYLNMFVQSPTYMRRVVDASPRIDHEFRAALKQLGFTPGDVELAHTIACIGLLDESHGARYMRANRTVLLRVDLKHTEISYKVYVGSISDFLVCTPGERDDLLEHSWSMDNRCDDPHETRFVDITASIPVGTSTAAIDFFTTEGSCGFNHSLEMHDDDDEEAESDASGALTDHGEPE